MPDHTSTPPQRASTPPEGEIASLLAAETLEDVLHALVDHAWYLRQMAASAYIVEDGVCVLIDKRGPVNTRVVSQCASTGEISEDQETCAVPVANGDEIIAILSSSARIAGERMRPHLRFLADVASACAARLDATGSRPLLPAGPADLGVANPLRAMSRFADLVLMTFDGDGILTYVNPYAADLLGLESSEAAGQRLGDILSRAELPGGAQEIEAQMRRVREGRNATAEVVIHVSEEASRVIRLQVSPVLRPDGAIDSVVMFGVDVTEHREAEQALRRTNEALEQARAEAERSAKARTEFLTSMSHEIRTPLNAIIGTTTLLVDNAVTSETGEHAEILRSSAEHLLSVINEILDISKLETNRVDIDDDRFAVDALIESSLDLVMGPAAGKGLEVSGFVVPGTPDHLFGDAPRLRQVLVNLLSNAVKFTDSGTVELICQGHFIGPNRVELVFEVSDTGSGIPADELDVLFEPFVQARSNRSGTEGTGLGLSISERLVRLMGGTITVRSTVGVGTTFTVSVPLQVDTSEHLPDSEAEQIDLTGVSVLIVDDIEINRRVLEADTRRWNMTPTLCSSPLDALALVDGGRRFDVALLDLHMPEMNGDALARALKERGQGSLILLSSTESYGDDGLFEARLFKPIKRQQLLTAIRQALGQAPPMAPVRPTDDRTTPLAILVAEDNIVNQKVIRALFARLGHEVDIVSDGLEAMKAVTERRYDLVLLDLRMPGMDGVETAGQIIEQLPDARPRLVALTASATEEERQRCFAAGMDDFVTKPITLNGLERLVRQATAPVHS